MKNPEHLWEHAGVIETEYYVHGKIKTVELVIIPAEFIGKPVFFGIGNDVSEKKKMEAQRQQSQKMEAMGRLAGGVPQ